MPNWCEGTLKIRSSNRENILNFIKECFMDCCYSSDGNDVISKPAIETGLLKIDLDYDDGIEVSLKPEKYHWIHLKDCGRSFIKVDPEDEYYEWIDYIAVFPFKTAWSITEEDWQEVSKKYNIDIRLYGIECGCQFVKEVEIINGKVTLYRIIQYTDWYWECPFPKMGG